MRNLNWILSSVLIVGLTLNSSCGGDDPVTPDPPTPQEIATTNLSKAWSLGTTGSVRRDASDVTADFANFSVTFTEGGSFTSSGGGDVWVDGSGSWTFTSTDPTDASSITIGSDVVTINVSANSLLLQFNIPEDGSGIGSRVSGINGDWEFSLQTN